MASPAVTTLAKVVNTAAEQLAFGPNDWAIWDTETDEATAASVAAVAGVQHFLRQIIVSTSAVPAAAISVTIKSGTTQIYPTINIGVAQAGPTVITFPVALQCAPGEALNIAATDPGNVTITVGGIGFSTPDQSTYSA